MFKFSEEKGQLKCSFCGKTQEQVRKLVAGPGVYICDECIELCNEIIEEEIGEDTDMGFVELPKPQDINEVLDQYVIVHEDAKKSLSVAVYNHYKRVNASQKVEDVELQKSNIVLIGPTGVGKTLLAQTLARILNVPFAIADATSLTEAGYVGEDVENILLKLLHAADMDVSAAEQGIIYVDEIDKIGKTQGNVSITRDVSGEGVQQALLKMIEGTVASVPPQGGRKHPEQSYIEIDTSHILFICGGTFSGLKDIISKRLGHRAIGFKQGRDTQRDFEDKELLARVEPEDLIQYGLIPEFVGRLPVLATLDELSVEDLVRILTEPRNAMVRQYQKMFELEDAELEFTNQALKEIGKKATNRGTGARGLRAIMEGFMLDSMYRLPEGPKPSKYVVTPAVVRGEKPIIAKKVDKKQRRTA